MTRLLHETFDIHRGPQRFRELIIYVSKKSVEDPHFGAIKLNKILYHSDFRAFERFGQPLTGMRYIRLQQGPAPRALLPVRNELMREGAIEIEVRQAAPDRHQQHRTVAKREPVMELFTPDEIAIVDEVICELWSQNATQVSDASHDIRWATMQHKDPMPYELAYLSNEPISDRENARTRELAHQLRW